MGNSEPLFNGKEHQTKTKKRKRKPIVVVRPRKAQPKKFKENESKIQDQHLVPLRQEIPTVSSNNPKKCNIFHGNSSDAVCLQGLKSRFLKKISHYISKS